MFFLLSRQRMRIFTVFYTFLLLTIRFYNIDRYGHCWATIFRKLKWAKLDFFFCQKNSMKIKRYARAGVLSLVSQRLNIYMKKNRLFLFGHSRRQKRVPYRSRRLFTTRSFISHKGNMSVTARSSAGHPLCVAGTRYCFISAAGQVARANDQNEMPAPNIVVNRLYGVRRAP